MDLHYSQALVYNVLITLCPLGRNCTILLHTEIVFMQPTALSCCNIMFLILGLGNLI